MKRQMSKNLTRREMLKVSGGLAACAPAVTRSVPRTGASSATQFPETQEPSALYKVVRPTGDVTIQMIAQAPRLGTLEGKTVCMVINGSFKSWVTAPIIEDLLRKKYPALKVIPATEVPRSQKAPAHGTTTPETDAMIAALKQKGCHAVISGNGG